MADPAASCCGHRYCDYLVTVMLEGQLALAQLAPRADPLPSHSDAVPAGSTKSDNHAKAAAGAKSPTGSKRGGKARKGRDSVPPALGNGQLPAATQLPDAHKGGKKAAAAHSQRLRSDADLKQALVRPLYPISDASSRCRIHSEVVI